MTTCVDNGAQQLENVMNSKEMQAAIEALVKANSELTSVVESQGQQISALIQGRAEMEHKFEETYIAEQEIKDQVRKLAELLGYDENDPCSPFFVELKELKATVDDLRTKVEGRNKSAAVKRNMTDADAHRALKGDVKDMDHKLAAEEMGLTYAQVYSCRLQFTFKHVHKELKEAGWVNPWSSKK
jgi:TolA-binding protein